VESAAMMAAEHPAIWANLNLELKENIKCILTKNNVTLGMKQVT
jgi:hypothetical protein